MGPYRNETTKLPIAFALDLMLMHRNREDADASFAANGVVRAFDLDHGTKKAKPELDSALFDIRFA